MPFRPVMTAMGVAAILWALAVGMASAQGATAVFDCATASHSDTELATRLANDGWERSAARASYVAHKAAINFVGNVDGDKPETWRTTQIWAQNLASATLYNEMTLFWRDGTWVEIGTRDGNRFCLITSSNPMLNELAEMLSDDPKEHGKIRRLRFEDKRFRISAHELSAVALDEWDLPDNHRFVATLIAFAPRGNP